MKLSAKSHSAVGKTFFDICNVVIPEVDALGRVAHEAFEASNYLGGRISEEALVTALTKTSTAINELQLAWEILSSYYEAAYVQERKSPKKGGNHDCQSNRIRKVQRDEKTQHGNGTDFMGFECDH